MDSSDSDCFESADEDVSEENTEVSIKNVTTIVTKNLATKKDESNSESKETQKDETIPTIKENELETPTSLNINDNVIINQTPSLDEEQNVKLYKVITKNDTGKSDVLNKEARNHNLKNNKGLDKELNVKLSKNKLITQNDTVKSNVLYEETQNDNLKNNKAEENLWNDEELNWNEEIVDNKLTQDIKTEAEKKLNENETDLWDDSELDWGEESKIDYSIKSNPISESKTTDSESWGGWSNWGSVLNTATQSVTSITSHVSQGLSTVIESSIGAMDPEEMARLNIEANKAKNKETETKNTPEKPETSFTTFGFGNLIKLVETTSNKVITGGLDTLETIGKKTFEALQDGDPGLKKKRAFLKLDGEKVVLSQILREAKDKVEMENRDQIVQKVKNYETLFDDHGGLIHLEALELLSKQCEIKLKIIQDALFGKAFTETNETLEQVKELCQLPDEEEEQLTAKEIKTRLESSISDLKIPINFDKLRSVWEETEDWLDKSYENCDANELHHQGIEHLARLTAISVEVYHKIGELLMVKEHRSTTDEADALVQSTTTLTCLIGIVAAKFSDKLNTKIEQDLGNKIEINGLITNIFLEASNSSSYIQDALQLLIPVLQVGAV